MASEGKRHYFYVLRCQDGTFYAGYTTDPERREKEHNNGIGSKYTKTRRPVQMIAVQAFETRSEATKAEAAFKKKTRKEKEHLLATWKENEEDGKESKEF